VITGPFNGWYQVTEIGTRNLGDEKRYNLLPQVGEHLGYDISSNLSLWKDEAINVLNQSVMHSFQQAGISIVDHFSTAESFSVWYKDEMSNRGYCPANWKWIIPPQGGSATPLYLELNRAIEYTVKPSYIPGTSLDEKIQCARKHGHLERHDDAESKSIVGQKLALRFALKLKKAAHISTIDRPKVVILYGTTSGKTARHALTRVYPALSRRMDVPAPLDMGSRQIDWKAALQQADYIIAMVATTNYGDLPPGVQENFVDWSQTAEGKQTLSGRSVAVLGFGSSSYPRFCEAAHAVQRALTDAGSEALFGVCTADELSGEEDALSAFMLDFLDSLAIKGSIKPPEKALMWSPDSAKNDRTSVLSEAQLVRVDADAGLGSPPPVAVSVAATVASQDKIHDEATAVVLNPIAGSFPPHMPGDSIKVTPRNTETSALMLSLHLGLDGNLNDMYQVQLKAGKQSAAASWLDEYTKPFALRRFFCEVLDQEGKPPRELLGYLATLVEGADHDTLLQLAANEHDWREWLTNTGTTVRELFEAFPTLSAVSPSYSIARFQEQCALQILQGLVFFGPVMQPRYYSITSSQDLDGDTTVSLYVGHVAYTRGSKTAYGLCSTMLTQTALRSTVLCELKPALSFRLPLSMSASVLCIGAGTGLAPFRSFWRQRAYMLRQREQMPVGLSSGISRSRRSQHDKHEKNGSFVLFHGVQTPEREAFAHEIQTMISTGAVTDYFPAYSRIMPKEYVQDSIRANPQPVLAVFEAGGDIYICGSSHVYVVPGPLFVLADRLTSNRALARKPRVLSLVLLVLCNLLRAVNRPSAVLLPLWLESKYSMTPKLPVSR
jgi:sulfite reductase alpha subunit-like flavoprotein